MRTNGIVILSLVLSAATAFGQGSGSSPIYNPTLLNQPRIQSPTAAAAASRSSGFSQSFQTPNPPSESLVSPTDVWKAAGALISWRGTFSLRYQTANPQQGQLMLLDAQGQQFWIAGLPQHVAEQLTRVQSKMGIQVTGQLEATNNGQRLVRCTRAAWVNNGVFSGVWP
jgi:hypothetical protein